MISALTQRILYLDDNIADEHDLVSLFGAQDQVPGTFTIAERKTCPHFLPEFERKLGYYGWIGQVIRRDIALLMPFCKGEFSEHDIDDLVNEAIALLDLPLPNGKVLCEAIPNQIYGDIVRRVLMFLLFRDPSHIVHTFNGVNRRGLQIALQIIKDGEQLNPESRMKRAVLAGLVGLDQKDAASAASHIVQTRIIPIGPEDNPRPIEEIRKELESRVTSVEWGINCWADFESEVLECIDKLVWLTDDYIEVVFDLDTAQALLRRYPHLSIWLIPKWSQYGNDASYQDVMHMLSQPEFSFLRYSNRFRVCDDGPRLGTIDPRAISPRTAKWLLGADCLVVKGARSYEMLQGIRKLTYYAFAACREISETVTGLEASLALPVFIRQAPGEHSFLDFRASSRRRIRFPSGRMVGLAATTACEYVGRDRCKCYDALGDSNTINGDQRYSNVIAASLLSGETGDDCLGQAECAPLVFNCTNCTI